MLIKPAPHCSGKKLLRWEAESNCWQPSRGAKPQILKHVNMAAGRRSFATTGMEDISLFVHKTTMRVPPIKETKE